jgi:pimeloyl-ACP methyl ester carboxylesterase
VLILTTKNESAGNAAWRTALRRAYPGAEFHLLEAGGHHPALVHPDEYRRVVREFLSR